jgi:hypothetical protein
MPAKSPEKYKDQLRRQLGFLHRSCLLFDAAFHDEAIRIATVVRILVHDTPKSTSLLTYLGGKSISFLSTCEPMDDVRSCLFFECLDRYSSGDFKPKLGASTFKEEIPVELWWRQVVVLLERGRQISRRDLVLAAANRDGGAHVDDLTPDYQRLTDGSWVLASQCAAPGPDEDLLGQDIFRETHFMALRQIGYEVLNSPDLLDLAEVPPETVSPGM